MQQTKKTRIKTILKQDNNSRQIIDIVPVSKKKEKKIKTLLSSPIQLAHHPITAADVAPLPLRCRTNITPLSLLCYHSFCRYTVATQSLLLSPPLLLHCRSTVAPLLLRCCSAVTTLSSRYRSAVTPLTLQTKLSPR